jgi:hypothetical protein
VDVPLMHPLRGRMSNDFDGILSSPIDCAKAVTIDSFPNASQLLGLQRNDSFGEVAALCQ